MKISKKAWHYGLFKWGKGDTHYENVSLCLYFWLVVDGILKMVFIPCLIAFVVGGLGYGIFLTAKFAILMYHYWPIKFIEVVLGAALGSVTYHLTRRYIRNRRRVERPPSLLRAYIKARKERFCPTIEFVE